MSTIVKPIAVTPNPKPSPQRALPLAAARKWDWGRAVHVLLGVELVLLLALAQVMFAGYRVGVGNQSIQIPFLKHWMNGQLYAADPMVQKTLGDYPSMFFKGLAKMVGWVDSATPTRADGSRPIDPVIWSYFWLHVLTAAAVMGAAYALGRAMFKDRAAAVVLVLLMACGHHHALAGDELYSIGFTHTWAVFPMIIGAMALLYRGWTLAAFAVVGIVFNFHALTAAYLMVMFMAWAGIEFRQRKTWLKLALYVGVFAILASPTALEMVRNHQQWGAEWLEKTKLRSADHSFPSTWWTAGETDVPRFILLAALAAISMSFVTDRQTRRKSVWMLAAVAMLFTVGYVFTEIWPKAIVVRAQLFRASRLAMVLMLAHIAQGIVGGWRAGAWWGRSGARGISGWAGSSDRPAPGVVAGRAPQAERLKGVGGVLEMVLAAALFVCVAIPGMMALAPWLVLAGTAIALLNGRLSMIQAIVAALALLATLIAFRMIEFHIPIIDGGVSLEKFKDACAKAGWMLLLALGLAAITWTMMRLRVGPRAKLCILTAMCVGVTVLGVDGYRRSAFAGVSKEDPWVLAQLWVARNTPADSVVLVPMDKGGFRIHSNRAVVGEWRDGTQLYFTAAFAQDWWTRMAALSSLGVRREPQIANLARQFGARYAVLKVPSGTAPSKEDDERPGFEKVFDSRESLPGASEAWAIYRPVLLTNGDKKAEFARLAEAAAAGQDSWVLAQWWVASNTPRDSVVLVPVIAGKEGFDSSSGRSSVAYAPADGAPNEKPLVDMTEAEIAELAKAKGARYVVLPSPAKTPLKDFLKLFDTRDLAQGKVSDPKSVGVREPVKEGWAIYRPVVLKGEEEQFVELSREKIAMVRMSEASVQVVGADGKSLPNAEVSVRQTKQAFLFGVSIPPFADLTQMVSPEWTAPQVTPKQLEMVKGVFNFSVIPFSAKWNMIEPTEGDRRYEELDKYVDWCTKNGLEMEFHYLGGFTPRWVQQKSVEGQREAWMRHCLDVAERYHGKIKYWQVTNDARLSRWASDAIKQIRDKYPDIKLGISDCSTFWYRGFDPSLPLDRQTVGDPSSTILKGSEEIEELQADGAKLDFYATHGHKPNGVWPDMRTIYAAFDGFAKYGVKVQISEATLDIGLDMMGPGKEGMKWDAEKSADFFEKYYTVVFSHPAAEALNYWDLSNSIVRMSRAMSAMGAGGTGQAGLLDPRNGDAPRPLYTRLKKLITQDWMTRFSASTGNDGVVTYPGRYFHGDYEVIVKVDGRELKGTFTVKPGLNDLKVKVE